jgi:hypothetical protein
MLYELVFNFDFPTPNLKYVQTKRAQRDAIFNAIRVNNTAESGFFNIFINNEKVFTDDIEVNQLKNLKMPFLLFGEKINQNDEISVLYYTNWLVTYLQIIIELI